MRPRRISGARKAAVVIASLPREAGAALLSRLDPREAQAVSLEIARLGELPEGVAEEILREFVAETRSGGIVLRDGVESASDLLRAALPAEEARAAVERLEAAIGRKPFEFLREVDADMIAAHMRDEQAQTVALVLSHIGPGKAAKVIERLPARMQGEVVRRIAHLREISADALREVEAVLAERLGGAALVPGARAGGAEQAADILRRAGRSAERSALDAIEFEEPELVDRLRRSLFSFEDLLGADDRGMRALLKEVSSNDLAVALKAASEELAQKFIANLSARAREVVQDEIEYMRPVRISEVESAQQRILDSARRLEDTGEMFIAGRSREEDFIA